MAFGTTGERPQGDYAELKRRVHAAGLLGRRPAFYALLITANCTLLALCFLCLWRFHEPWALVLEGIGLGLVSGQLGFQLHDAAHHQVFERAWKNRLLALVTGNLLIGISAGWWIDEHTRHHANPNHLDLDPDLSNVALAYSAEQAMERGRVFRLVAAYQAILLLPLVCLLTWSMHEHGVTFLVRRGLRRSWTEAVLLLAHAAAYLALLLLLLGPWAALLVVVVQKTVSGIYLASVVATNHHGMPQLDHEPDFLRRQVLTARNVRSGPLTDLWYGSLNYQIEHHLFPRMTRPDLRRARPLVRQFCAERGIPYHETTMTRSYVELLQFLHQVGAPLRRRAA